MYLSYSKIRVSQQYILEIYKQFHFRKLKQNCQCGNQLRICNRITSKMMYLWYSECAKTPEILKGLDETQSRVRVEHLSSMAALCEDSFPVLTWRQRTANFFRLVLLLIENLGGCSGDTSHKESQYGGSHASNSITLEDEASLVYRGNPGGGAFI